HHMTNRYTDETTQAVSGYVEAVAKTSSRAPSVEVPDREMTLHLRCHGTDDSAQRICTATRFRVAVHRAQSTKGQLPRDASKQRRASVTLWPFMTSACKYEVRNGTPAAPKLFADAGIPFSIMTDHPFIPINYLNLCAAEAVRHGLSDMRARRSITSQAAKQ